MKRQGEGTEYNVESLHNGQLWRESVHVVQQPHYIGVEHRGRL